METAFRMQFAATSAFDLNRESEVAREEYSQGVSANACRLARAAGRAGRAVYPEIYYGDGQAVGHASLSTTNPTRKLAADIDRPMAALLATDLRRSGLLDDTLVVWGGDSGRTPTTTKSSDGQDHNHLSFTMWLAGGGVRGGLAYGRPG